MPLGVLSSLFTVSMLFSAAVSYFTQSLVNLNQPITTPYFYVVLAAGVGYVRYKAQGYGVFKEKAEN